MNLKEGGRRKGSGREDGISYLANQTVCCDGNNSTEIWNLNLSHKSLGIMFRNLPTFLYNSESKCNCVFITFFLSKHGQVTLL